MPGVVRLGDLCTGHGSHPPRPSIQGVDSVLINGRPVVVVGNNWASHPHPGNQSTGSNNVFINGLPVARIGDSISCGSSNKDGSSDVIING